MAQAPATSKPHRLALRLAAPLGLAGRLPQATSERVALAARASAPRTGPTAEPEVLFLMPLVGRHHVGDWNQITDRLAATIKSFQAQTSSRWRLLICGQDKPDLDSDPRIEWLPFTTQVDGNDKWAKLAALSAALADRGPAQGYAMPLDADDLLAPWVVAHMCAQRSPGGYLVTRGHVHDAGTGGLAEARPQSLLEPGQKAFWKLCGSCAAFRCDKDNPDDRNVIAAATQHEHRMFPYLAGLAGRPLAPLPEPSVLYMVNHGENFGVRRGRVGFKTRFVRRFPVADPRLRRDILLSYGLPVHDS